MPKITDIENGIYCLVLECLSPTAIKCKRFKDVIFSAGYYYYVGSAQKNFKARIKRHLDRKKKIHWHIDHLTTSKNFKIKEVLIFNKKNKSYECIFSQDLLNKFETSVIAPHFGNSDCNKCITHLYYKMEHIPYSHFISRYQSMVRFIPSSKGIF